MSFFGKEENIEKAQELANEDNINRDVKKVEYEKYLAEKRKYKIEQANKRAVEKARQPSFFASLMTNIPTPTGKRGYRKAPSLASIMGSASKPRKYKNTIPNILGVKKRKGRIPKVF